MGLQHLSTPQVHVYAAGQAGIEAAHGPHDVDALEFLRAIFLEDRSILHRILIGSGGAVDVTRIGIPRGGRIGMVVGDLALADDNMMRKHPPHRLVKAAADGLFRTLKSDQVRVLPA